MIVDKTLNSFTIFYQSDLQFKFMFVSSNKFPRTGKIAQFLVLGGFLKMNFCYVNKQIKLFLVGDMFLVI